MKPVSLHAKEAFITNKKDFEQLLSAYGMFAERYIYCKTGCKSDGDDIIQEVYLTAFTQFEKLTDRSRFKAWLLGIARNKCADFYRKRYKAELLSIEELSEIPCHGGFFRNDVIEILDALSENDSRILKLFYLDGLPLRSIAQKLSCPEGTVKSRLFAAKKRFRSAYTDDFTTKGGINMKTLPEYAPKIKITRLNAAPFKVICIQQLGYFATPIVGEKGAFGFYEFFDDGFKRLTAVENWKVENKALIHDVECIEIKFENQEHSRSCFIRLTDTHFQDIAYRITNKFDGYTRISTFLDDEFYGKWGFGENNCGEEVLRRHMGIITENSDGTVLSAANVELHNQDICGRYQVKIGEKIYDTIRNVYFNTLGEMTENYIDRDGRVVVFRRFSTDQKPDENRDSVIINGNVYVNEYCCLPDYVF